MNEIKSLSYGNERPREQNQETQKSQVTKGSRSYTTREKDTPMSGSE